jgi:hypothetical protein
VAFLAASTGVAVLGSGVQPAEADIMISNSGDGKEIIVDVTDETRKAIIRALARHFDLKVTGEISDGKAITARVRSDLSSVLSRLFGERSVMIIYGASGPEELVIINGQAEETARPVVRDVAVTATPIPEKRADIAEAPAKPTETPAPSSVPQTVVVSGFGADQMRPLLPRLAVSDRSEGDEGTAPPADVSDDDTAALNRRSADMLGSLVHALKALCPSGHKC